MHQNWPLGADSEGVKVKGDKPLLSLSVPQFSLVKLFPYWHIAHYFWLHSRKRATQLGHIAHCKIHNTSTLDIISTRTSSGLPYANHCAFRGPLNALYRPSLYVVNTSATKNASLSEHHRFKTFCLSSQVRL